MQQEAQKKTIRVFYLYRTRRGQKSIKNLSVKFWNFISEKMHNLTFSIFKQAYRSVLQENSNSI